MSTYKSQRAKGSVRPTRPYPYEGQLPIIYEEPSDEPCPSGAPVSSPSGVPVSSHSTSSSSPRASSVESPPDWEPEDEPLGEDAKRALREHGIVQYLQRLQKRNYETSAKRWSEFPDGAPEFADLGPQGLRYQPTALKLHHVIDASSLLQCQRCGTMCDLDYNIVGEDQCIADPHPVVYLVPYGYCPLKSIQQCHSTSTQEWDAAETRTILIDKHKTDQDLEQHLLKMTATKIGADKFQENHLEPVTREIFNTYRGFRVFWHHLLLVCQTDPDYYDKSETKMINDFPLWGDLMTDVTLVQKNLICRQQIDLMYGISVEGADYLYRWQDEWEFEVRWLNAYVGQVRHMASDRRSFCRDIAEKIGKAMSVLVEAEASGNGTYDTLLNLRGAKVEARALFRELHSIVVKVE